jgi:hypothetical protein
MARRRSLPVASNEEAFSMETCVVTFYGAEQGPDGLPQQLHRYFVVASPAPGLGRNATVASVVALTSAPEPAVPHFVVPSGTESDAIARAVSALEALPGNKGLQKD